MTRTFLNGGNITNKRSKVDGIFASGDNQEDDMKKEKTAALYFQRLSREEKSTYLSRLREIANTQAPVQPATESADAKDG